MWKEQLEIIKSILNLSDISYEPLITLRYKSIRSKVLDYCNRIDKNVPESLEILITEIALSQLENEFSNNTQTIQGTGAIKKKTMGGTTIEYDVGTTVVNKSKSSSSDSFLNNYEQRLRPHIRVATY